MMGAIRYGAESLMKATRGKKPPPNRAACHSVLGGDRGQTGPRSDSTTDLPGSGPRAWLLGQVPQHPAIRGHAHRLEQMLLRLGIKRAQHIELKLPSRSREFLCSFPECL